MPGSEPIHTDPEDVPIAATQIQGADAASGGARQELPPEEASETVPKAEDPKDALPETESRSGEGPTLRIGEIIAQRYHIVRFLGRGGMGEVYEAQDRMLRDRIAIKIVRPRVASAQAASRFKREIQLARKVTHANVCRIFDVGVSQSSASAGDGDAADFLFLTMEPLEGETLSKRLRREGQLQVAEAQPILLQVAEALAAAHTAGVIHRDLKLANIMLIPAKSGIRAVITDFGLSCSLSDVEESGDPLTTGHMVGTPDYMAPELLGGKEATTASDVYSFGVVLYATVTGRMPFEVEGGRPALRQRLGQDPVSPVVHVPTLGKRWEQLILRCLARNPRDRFASAADLVEALREPTAPATDTNHPPRRTRFARFTLAAGVIAILICVLLLARFGPTFRSIRGKPALPGQKQLAVIPFAAMDGTAEAAAFARGLAETLAARLTRLTTRHPLQIVPVEEVRLNHIESVQQARREFGVNLGIEGSVQHYGPKVRVTYHLVDAATLQELRGETVTSAESDPFALEDQVASSVEKALDLELGPEERVHTDDPVTQPVAYDFVLQGRGYLADYTRPQSLESAIEVYSRAVELDPKYAPAFAGLGQAFWHKYEDTKDSSLVQKAKEACASAVGFGSNLADGHICLGTVYKGTDDYSNAAREFRRAVELDPTSDEAVRGLASALASLGRPKEAEDAYEAAIRLRPNYWGGYNMLGVFYFRAGRYDGAEKMFRQVMALSPDNYRGPSNLGGLYSLEGRYKDAIPFLNRAISLRPSADAYSNLGSAYYFSHRFGEAATAYRRALALNNLDYLMWGNLAEATVQIPDKRQEAQPLYRRAISLAEQQLQVTPKDSTLLGNLALYYSMLDDKGKADNYLKESLALNDKDPFVRFNAAEVYKRNGDVEQALHWVSAAVAAGYSPTLARENPAFADLKTDPRFVRIVPRDQ
jgi:tetratricopeptide (TPR) repeat protein/tRNA A-37 threonylcarbamoyl transferase component Bud32